MGAALFSLASDAALYPRVKATPLFYEHLVMIRAGSLGVVQLQFASAFWDVSRDGALAENRQTAKPFIGRGC